MDNAEQDELRLAMQTMREEMDALKAKLNQANALTAKVCDVDLAQAMGGRVKLNVGGARFETTRDTLCRYRDSYFGAMFSGVIDLPTDEDGRVFIDRSGEHFHRVLDFLRTGSMRMPDSKGEREAVRDELRFYKLDAHVPQDDLLEAPATRQRVQPERNHTGSARQHREALDAAALKTELAARIASHLDMPARHPYLLWDSRRPLHDVPFESSVWDTSLLPFADCDRHQPRP